MANLVHGLIVSTSLATVVASIGCGPDWEPAVGVDCDRERTEASAQCADLCSDDRQPSSPRIGGHKGARSSARASTDVRAGKSTPCVEVCLRGFVSSCSNGLVPAPTPAAD